MDALNPPGARERVFIGWDVGGWNCDRNRGSRDAPVVLDAAGETLGRPWRGNLRTTINAANSASEFVAAILSLCQVSGPDEPAQATIAIDAPLAFPEGLMRMLTAGETVDSLESSFENPYLYRFTERRLVSERIRLLSSVKDMIGSQATKAMHVVARFFPEQTRLGVWTDTRCRHAIEAYPRLCRSRPSPALEQAVTAWQQPVSDVSDARVCAFIAHELVLSPENLEAPVPQAPPSEGWIWATIRHLRQHRFRWEARPGRDRRDDSVCARSPFADDVKT